MRRAAALFCSRFDNLKVHCLSQDYDPRGLSSHCRARQIRHRSLHNYPCSSVVSACFAFSAFSAFNFVGSFLRPLLPEVNPSLH